MESTFSTFLLLLVGYLIGYIITRLKEPSLYIRDLYLKRLDLYQNFYNEFCNALKFFIMDAKRENFDVIINTIRKIENNLESNCLYVDHRAYDAISYSLHHLGHGLIEFYPLEYEIKVKVMNDESRSKFINSIIGLKNNLHIELIYSLKMFHIPFRIKGMRRKKKMKKLLNKSIPGTNKTWLEILKEAEFNEKDTI